MHDLKLKRQRQKIYKITFIIIIFLLLIPLQFVP